MGNWDYGRSSNERVRNRTLRSTVLYYGNICDANHEIASARCNFLFEEVPVTYFPQPIKALYRQEVSDFAEVDPVY
jgi:hypothetical protein